VAKGNDGNYLQHSIEVAVAIQLAKLSAEGKLHLSITHGMAPFESCDVPPKYQAQHLLHEALAAAKDDRVPGEAHIVTAYRATKASLQRYPNTGELLAAMLGRNRLTGGITEVNKDSHKALMQVWLGSSVNPVHASWRSQVGSGGVLSCPADLAEPWLFTSDPMTFFESGTADDANLYGEDLAELTAVLNGFITTGKPGVASLFVYKMAKFARPGFWRFADDLAFQTGATLVSGWVVHQGGNHNLAALLCFGISVTQLPDGVNAGR
jgi:hypothetical protein